MDTQAGQPIFSFKISYNNLYVSEAHHAKNLVFGITKIDGERIIVRSRGQFKNGSLNASFTKRGWLEGYVFLDKDRRS